MFKFIDRDHVGHRTTGVNIGHDHFLAGGNDRRRFGHKINSAKNNEAGCGLGCLKGKAERVPDIVGNVLDLRQLVVMRQDDCLPLLS